MSRIILTEHRPNEDHVVVGWDRPLATFYWQEFNKEPDPDPQSGEVDWEAVGEWEEMRGFSGYIPNEHPTISSMLDSMPVKFRPLVTDEVKSILESHVHDPNTGRTIVRMPVPFPDTPASYKVEVKTIGSDKFNTNGIRLGTKEEAEAYAKDLTGRWLMVEEWRVEESNDPVNYKWEDGKAVSV